eukprot:TRINITY_DN24314_c0_g1_i1.p1 TRINITY_DN24314_c0_g1~~TRINITY_DN24314_c0_g1_i1.p1  ORF type:complete len:378 (+),score=84.00 TRINITY_DN24314_c0_g1_i1:63-1196(+)
MPKGDFPRGSGGCVLYPGTRVQIHGLKAAQTMNNKEGLCRDWNPAAKRMTVELLGENGKLKAFKPENLRKVKEVDDDPELDKILKIFETFDLDGNGILDKKEFTSCLSTLGLPASVLDTFLDNVDKDGDCEIQYEEFARWCLSSTDKSEKARHEVYWPSETIQAEAVESDDEADKGFELASDRPLSLKDIEKICGGDIPEGWPKHGVTVVNNCRVRFPDYPVEGIVWLMRKNDFVGGKVIHAIRGTGAREVEAIPASAVCVGKHLKAAFPATYRNRCVGGEMQVYEESSKDWSFANMRDQKIFPIGCIRSKKNFTVLEVRRGSEYGFCFGRIKYEDERDSPCWVVLGMEMNRSLVTQRDSDLTLKDLNYTDAERLSY